MNVPIAANVLGTMGAVCWSIQLLPQIVINHRRHDTTGLQPTMMMLWAWAGVPLGVYNIAESFSIALRIQPQILTVLSLITWIQCFYYEQVRAPNLLELFLPKVYDIQYLKTESPEAIENELIRAQEANRLQKWTLLRCLIVVLPIACLMAGIQASLIFAIRSAKERHLEWPSILMAVASAVLLAAGVLRHYVDVYLYRTVRGISFIFVGIDALGDIFSLVSVVFQPKLDILGLVIYGTEFVLWMGIFACGAHYNFAPWMKEQHSRRTKSRAADNFDATTTTGVVLHDLPSSTSVFRTPCAELQARQRRNVNAQAN